MRYIYFLRPVGQEGPVKIGYSRMPHIRLQYYMHWSPYPLEIAAEMPGESWDEQALHKRFAAHRTHHEWFTANTELTDFIKSIAAPAQPASAA